MSISTNDRCETLLFISQFIKRCSAPTQVVAQRTHLFFDFTSTWTAVQSIAPTQNAIQLLGDHFIERNARTVRKGSDRQYRFIFIRRRIKISQRRDNNECAHFEENLQFGYKLDETNPLPSLKERSYSFHFFCERAIRHRKYMAAIGRFQSGLSGRIFAQQLAFHNNFTINFELFFFFFS